VAVRAAGWRSPQRGGSSKSAGASALPLFGGCALTVASSLRAALARRLYGHSAALEVDAPHTVSHMKARYALVWLPPGRLPNASTGLALTPAASGAWSSGNAR